jgi:DNA end-binding protein Ku
MKCPLLRCAGLVGTSIVTLPTFVELAEVGRATAEDDAVPRAMWKGAIQFGLVTIPIKLYLATESKYGVSFNMLHETDLSRIQMKVWCPADEKVISRSETVKGYEYAPDQYVVITDEDLERVPLKTVRSIEIEQFTKRDDGADGHVRFVKQAYYVEPDKIGRKAFYLLKQVLEEDELVAICKVVIKDREALAALEPFGRTILLTTLHWPDEVRSTSELDLPDEEYDFKPAEIAMARQLVGAMTGDFEAESYRDEYRDALLEIIEQKVEGREVVAPEPVEETGKLVDLMAALEASVKAARAGRGEAPVSVKEAKEAREAKEAGQPRDAKKRPSRAAASKVETGAGRKTTRRASRPAQSDEAADEAESARPARRRKSA